MYIVCVWHLAYYSTTPLFTQGKAKAKLLNSLSSSLSQTQQYVSAEAILVGCSGLKKGVNTGRVFLGGLVAVVPFKERVP